MKAFPQFLRKVNIYLGFLTLAVFAVILIILIRLQPKMIAFDPLSTFESNILTGVGFGLLIILAFFLLSLLQLVRFMRMADSLRPVPLIMFIGGVLSVLLVFSNVTLLSDIAKQYQAGLSQPEWAMFYPMFGFQFVFALIFLYFLITGFFNIQQLEEVARDVNIFLMVQYVGVICGGMGLGMAILGFVYRSGWSLVVHTILSSLTIIFPYVLAVIYWGIIKIKEKDREWWDEKQSQDVGKSALLTLGMDTLVLLALFVFNIRDLDGAVRMIWLPMYLFASIFTFSLGNLFFSSKA